MNETVVRDARTLAAALASDSAKVIVVENRITGIPTFSLSPGKALVGRDAGAELVFADGGDGLCMTSDNRLESIALQVSDGARAVYNHPNVPSLGRLELKAVRTRGQVQILVRDQVRSGHIAIDGLDIVDADARAGRERPRGYGVHVVQGALTIWNMQSDPGSTVTAHLTDIRIGRPGRPVRGGGVFVSGAGDTGGRLQVSRLHTGPVYSDGGIPPGTPDLISGGVFVVHGAFVDVVLNTGPVSTYGANDMVLDNWGTVDRWTAEDKITSFGPSGIGFVNFGLIDTLRVHAPIETHGQGARGFNVYTGTVRSADFDRVVTHGHGAVGIQVSQPVGRIRVRRGIETHGGTGDSLVKGVVVNLAAIAFSVKPGGSVRELVVDGGLVTHAPGIEPLELHGSIASLELRGGCGGTGGGFESL